RGGGGRARPRRRPAATRGPRERVEAEREGARAGRRGLGAPEERSAGSARAPDGPPEEENRRPSARALEPADGVWGHRRSAARAAREHRTGPQKKKIGGRARERSSRPT